MGGGISKAELEKVQAEKADLEKKLAASAQKEASEAKLTAAEKAKVAAEKAKVEALSAQVQNLEAKLKEEQEKAVKRVMRVAANILMPKSQDVSNDDATADTVDSVEDDTREAIDMLMAESAHAAGADPLNTALQQQVEALEARLADERESNDRLGSALLESQAMQASAEEEVRGDDNESEFDDMSMGTTTLHPAATPMDSITRTRDYSVLVDASASMRLVDRGTFGRSRWDLAREALEVLVPQIVERDEDGITLYFFSSGYRKFTHVNSTEMVRFNFQQEKPRGGTQLVEALTDAVIPDNVGRPETVLVITDGAPENRHLVEQAVQDASNDLARGDDLRIVFVQVGHDAAAERWLAGLKASLTCRYDIVETISSEQLSRTGVPFAQWVARSVMPDVILGGGGAYGSQTMPAQSRSGGSRGDWGAPQQTSLSHTLPPGTTRL